MTMPDKASIIMRKVQFRWFIITGLCTTVFWLALLTSIETNSMENDLQLQSILKPKANYDTNNDSLVDLHDFRFVINNVSLCMASMTDSEENQSAIAIIVHSARSHFENRYAIRNTWGSVKKFKGWHFHLTFLLGIDPKGDQKLESELWEESRQHGDMIMGSFVDSYKNLTYKHLMGYKWVTTFCPSAKFILKTDDDMFADVFQVVEVLLFQRKLTFVRIWEVTFQFVMLVSGKFLKKNTLKTNTQISVLEVHT